MKWHNKIKKRNDRDDAKMITLSIGYDGAPYTDSSKKSLWPLLCFIKDQRFKILLLNALHAGSSKPEGILEAFVKELESLDKTPVEMVIEGKIIKVYVRLLVVVGDAPARCDIRNFNSHTALYGCRWCFTITK